MKREEVKGILPDLTDEQLTKIMDLHGADIERQKQTITTLTTERDAARTQLGEANKKLEGYDPDWKNKAAEAESKAKAQVAALQSDFAAQSAVSGVRFSCESARKAFLAELKAKNLTLQDGKLLGFDDFLADYKKTDPNAFVSGYPNVRDGGDPNNQPSGTASEQFAEWFNQVMK